MNHILILLLAIGTSVPASAQTTIRAMTLNTRHGGQAPWSVSEQVSEIVAENPDVVFLQEAGADQLDEYVNGVNAGLNTMSWHGAVSRHCMSHKGPGCSAPSAEGVMILSRFRFADVDPRLIWAADEFVSGRAVLRVKLRLDDATLLQAFSVHLPAGRRGRTARVDWTKMFKNWASMYPGSKIVGGDFNERPTSAAVSSMSSEYADAWGAKGRGHGATHAGDDLLFDSRIDYLFSSGSLSVESAFVPQVTLSDHRPVVADYAVVSTPAVASASPVRSPALARSASPAPAAPASTTDVVQLADDFEHAAIDTSKWPGGIYSGDTHDDTVTIAEDRGTLSIGPLKTAGGWHYNGISSGVYAMTGNAYAQVQLVQGASGADAYAMLTVGSDGSHFYRLYQTGAPEKRTLVAEKKINGTKHSLATVAFDGAGQSFWRIRHEVRPESSVDDVVIETSPTVRFEAAVELHREPWDPSVVASELSFELKAGTSGPNADVGSVVLWDNFQAVTQRPVSGR